MRSRDHDQTEPMLPYPDGTEQRSFMQVIWDWFQRRSSWPTYSQVVRAYDREVNGDCMDPWRALPAGLVVPSVPPSAPAPSQVLALTLAGAISCGFPVEHMALFLALVRLANQRWREGDEDSDEGVVAIDSEDARSCAAPDELSVSVLALIGSLLNSEPLGVASSSGLDGEWTVRFHDGIRRFRDVETAEDYWLRRTESLAGPPVTGSRLSGFASVPHLPDGQNFDRDLWRHVKHSVVAEQWAQVASQAIIFLESSVRKRAGSPQADRGGPLVGKDLMIKSLGVDGPLPLATFVPEIEGWRSLAQGLVAATGNVDRHRIQEREDMRQYAFGVLGATSLILTQIKYSHGTETLS